MTQKNKREIKTNPSRLDEVADEKYPISAEQTTRRLNDEIKSEDSGQNTSDFGNADDGASSLDEESVVGNDSDGNVSDEEVADLEAAANRMPDEQDDIADNDILDDEDDDGTPLNEYENPLGEDLDIDEEDEDANLYDDNE